MNQKPSVPRVRISEAANNRTGQANARETDSITDRKIVLARENFRTREKCGGREKRKEELEKRRSKGEKSETTRADHLEILLTFPFGMLVPAASSCSLMRR